MQKSALGCFSNIVNFRGIYFFLRTPVVELLSQNESSEEFGNTMNHIIEQRDYNNLFCLALIKRVFTFLKKRSCLTLPPQATPQATPHVTPHVGKQANKREKVRTLSMIAPHVDELMRIWVAEINPRFRCVYLKSLLEKGLLQMTIPNTPNNQNQKYIAVKQTN